MLQQCRTSRRTGHAPQGRCALQQSRVASTCRGPAECRCAICVQSRELMCTGHIKWPSRSSLRCWRPGRLALGQARQLSAAQGLTRMGRTAPTWLSRQYPGAQQRKHALLCSLKGADNTVSLRLDAGLPDLTCLGAGQPPRCCPMSCCSMARCRVSSPVWDHAGQPLPPGSVSLRCVSCC